MPGDPAGIQECAEGGKEAASVGNRAGAEHEGAAASEGRRQPRVADYESAAASIAEADESVATSIDEAGQESAATSIAGAEPEGVAATSIDEAERPFFVDTRRGRRRLEFPSRTRPATSSASAGLANSKQHEKLFDSTRSYSSNPRVTLALGPVTGSRLVADLVYVA